MSRRIAIGALADGAYGLRIAKSGYDADANPPVPANLIFDSQWPQLLPIHQIGVFTIGGNGSRRINIPTLGFIPLFSYMIKEAGDDWNENIRYNTQYYSNPKAVQAPASYLQIWITDGTVNGLAFTSGGSDPSWPSSFSIAYAIYKVAG